MKFFKFAILFISIESNLIANEFSSAYPGVQPSCNIGLEKSLRVDISMQTSVRNLSQKKQLFLQRWQAIAPITSLKALRYVAEKDPESIDELIQKTIPETLLRKIRRPTSAFVENEFSFGEMFTKAIFRTAAKLEFDEFKPEGFMRLKEIHALITEGIYTKPSLVEENGQIKAIFFVYKFEIFKYVIQGSMMREGDGVVRDDMRFGIREL